MNQVVDCRSSKLAAAKNGSLLFKLDVRGYDQASSLIVIYDDLE